MYCERLAGNLLGTLGSLVLEFLLSQSFRHLNIVYGIIIVSISHILIALEPLEDAFFSVFTFTT